MRIEHKGRQRAAADRGQPRMTNQTRDLWKNNWTQLLNCAFPDKSGPAMPEFSLAADSAEISNMRSVLPSQRPFTSHLGVAATCRYDSDHWDGQFFRQSFRTLVRDSTKKNVFNVVK